MSRFNFIALLAAMLAFSSVVRAEDLPQPLREQLSRHLTQADFTYVSEADVKVEGEGSFSIQDSCYVLDLGVLQIYCDGVRRWTVDKEAREVYIEPAEGSLAGAIAGYQVEEIKGLSDNGLRVTVQDARGTRITITVPRMKMTAKAEAGYFRFSTSSLSGDWNINDMTD